jgi:hypothetical protein
LSRRWQHKQSDVPHPISWMDLQKRRLDAAGLKSEAAFMRGARLVRVAVNATAMTLEATHTRSKVIGDGYGRCSASDPRGRSSLLTATSR